MMISSHEKDQTSDIEIDCCTCFLNGIRRLPELGYKDAMMNLSILCQEGDGTKIDEQKAEYWYKKYNGERSKIS